MICLSLLCLHCSVRPCYSILELLLLQRIRVNDLALMQGTPCVNEPVQFQAPYHLQSLDPLILNHFIFQCLINTTATRKGVNVPCGWY